MTGPPRPNKTRGSQLRQVTSGSFGGDDVDSGSHTDRGIHTDEPSLQDRDDAQTKFFCSLGLHDEGFSKDDVLVNQSLFAGQNVASGVRMRVTALETESPTIAMKRRHSRYLSNGRRSSSNYRSRFMGILD